MAALVWLNGCHSLPAPAAQTQSTKTPPALRTEYHWPATREPSTPSVTPSPIVTYTTFPSPTPTIQPTPVPTIIRYGPDQFPSQVNPLTGEFVEEPRLLERRPMAIKVSNFPRSVRPQWGLSLADHVYEYYLEDGLTRFVAVFYGKDAARVGPIRSARIFDAHIIQMYQAIFAFGYADDRVMDFFLESDFKNRLVIQRPDNCPPMCRIGPKNAYNTLFTNTAELSAYVSQRGTNNDRPDLHGLRFEGYSLLMQTAGKKAEVIAVRFSNTSYHLWTYDPASRQYFRDQEAESAPFGEETYMPLFDQLTAEQISADNLIVLLVPTGYFYKSKSTEMYDIRLIGEGTAYAFRLGRVFEAKWVRPSPEALLSICYTNGAPLPLTPGNTWFEVLGASSTHQVVNNTTWQFFFSIP